MATPIWQPGTVYIPGSLVQPLTAIESVPTSLDNPGFESGDLTGWDITVSNPGVTAPEVTNYGPRFGTYNLSFDCDGGAPLTTIRGLNTEQPPCDPGTSITANIWLKFSSDGSSGGRAILAFFDSGGTQIGQDVLGVEYKKPGNTSERWYQSPVSGVAPPGTDSVRAGFVGFLQNDADIRFDELTWNYTNSPVLRGLIYRAVQPDPGVSDNVEPTWPTTLGVQVIDNTVIWEAVQANRVTWQASPIMTSGAVEPTFPTSIGERVTDNNIAWEAVSRRIEDENCPNSKVVVIAASHVFAEDGDIVRFCAAANPKDWTTERNAGYLPTGLQQDNASGIRVLNQYRGDVVAFNASVFQNWQADPDPALMVLKDQLPGIGSIFQHAAQPVTNDLFYLPPLGVRSIGIAGGSTHLQSGDVGEPIDPLVREAMAVAQANSRMPRSTFYPGAGQYWLSFAGYPPSVLGIFGDLEYAGINVALPAFSYGASGGVMPYVFALANGTTMPPGLTLNPNGSVTGTPTTLGSFLWDVMVTDSRGDTAELTDSAQVVNGPTISGLAPDGTIGDSYSFTYTVAAGDNPIVDIQLQPGSTNLAGIGLAWNTATAQITGTPTAVALATLIPRVVDTLGVSAQLTDSFNIALGQGPTYDGVRWFTRSATAMIKPSVEGTNWTGEPQQTSTLVTNPRVVVGGSTVFIVGGDNAAGAYGSRTDLSTWTALPAFTVNASGPRGAAKYLGTTLYAPLGGGIRVGTPPWYVDGLARMRNAPAGSWDILPNIAHGVSGGTPTTAAIDLVGSVLVRVGAYYNLVSSDDGDNWSDGSVHAFGAGTALCATSSGSRMLIGGGGTGSAIMSYTNNGLTETLCTLPGGLNAPIVQVKPIKNSAWLACVGAGSSPTYGDKLLRSIDNGATFTAVSLGVPVRFANDSDGNIAMNTYSGRVVVLADTASGKALFYSDDDGATWTPTTFSDGPPTDLRSLST